MLSASSELKFEVVSLAQMALSRGANPAALIKELQGLPKRT